MAEEKNTKQTDSSAVSTPNGNLKTQKTVFTVVAMVLAVILLLLAGFLIKTGEHTGGGETTVPTVPTETTVPTEPTETTVPTEPTETTVPTEPTEMTEPVPTTEPEPVMLEHMAELYAENDALVGWLRIDGTVIDYPVVHTPENPEKYLRKDFYGNFSMAGTLFIEGRCSMDPESDNLIIYGHNMKNGSMFHTLLKYRKKSFWEEHPEIYFSTLYEERTYEIVAAFYDRVYFTHEKVFKFYRFIDYDTQEEFDEAIRNYQKKAQYDTGVIPVYGDKLITLVTCSYHEQYGRFVVVAREKTEQPTEQPIEQPAE